MPRPTVMKLKILATFLFLFIASDPAFLSWFSIIACMWMPGENCFRERTLLRCRNSDFPNHGLYRPLWTLMPEFTSRNLGRKMVEWNAADEARNVHSWSPSCWFSDLLLLLWSQMTKLNWQQNDSGVHWASSAGQLLRCRAGREKGPGADGDIHRVYMLSVVSLVCATFGCAQRGKDTPWKSTQSQTEGQFLLLQSVEV